MPYEAKQYPKPISFDALGTTWWIQADVPDNVINDVIATAEDFQSDYSRFDENSIISRLNKTKSLENPPTELLEMLSFATTISEKSDGLFNLTAGAELAKRGYGKLSAGKFIQNWTEKVTSNNQIIRLEADTNLEIGGFGKGWLVDKIFVKLKDAGATDILVNGGGDIRIEMNDDFVIPMMHPGKKNQYFAKASFKTGALASSSPIFRSWGENNHLVDNQGDSYEGDHTQVFTYADDAKTADAAATACIISKDPFSRANELGVELLLTKKDQTYEATNSFPILATKN